MPEEPSAERHERLRRFPKKIHLVQNGHRLAIVGGLLLALAIQWTAIGYWVEQEHHETRVQAEEVLGQLTVAVQEQTLRLFKDVEGALKTVDFWLATHPGIDPKTDPEVERLLAMIRDTSDGLIDIRLVSSGGDIFYGPTKKAAHTMNAADREYFQAQSNPETRGLYIGKPAQSRFNRQMAIPVSLPLSRPAGDISVLFASIALDRLVPMYEQVRFKPGGAIALLRIDGTLLSRAPLDPRHLGMSLADSADYKLHLSVQKQAIYTSTNTAIDGVSRLVSFSHVEEYPLIVSVSAGSEDTFESWERNRELILGIGALLSMMLIAGAGGILFVLSVVQKSGQQLQRQAMSDALTGCLNRRAFDDASEREFARAVRFRRPLTVITLDLDHFKRINDNYGHAAGDAVLRTLSAVWTDTVRTIDQIGRLGGEEFAILMPDTDLENGLLIAQRLLAITRETRVVTSGETLQITVSMGIAVSMPFDYSFGDLMERADGALYHAKRSGRDRIELR